jgi:beta-1,4-mannosyl-glycoprotein beta-1,4-N-acetylglucosaminyltransferase
MNSNLEDDKPRKIIDSFLFFNEIEMLKARLEYLGPHIDYFVISEANTRFDASKKDFILNKELIKNLPFAEKIIYHRENINFFHPKWLWKKIKYCTRKSKFLWQIQNAQRNAILIPLWKFQPTDIVIFGDLDEIPHVLAIQEVKNHFTEKQLPPDWALSCDQKFFYYHINHCSPDEKWYGSIFTQLSFMRKEEPHRIRGSRNRLPHIDNGGWHFSYFLSPEKIKEKISAIADVENISSFKNISSDEIKRKIKNGQDLYERNIKFSSAPATIPNNLKAILIKYLPNCTD